MKTKLFRILCAALCLAALLTVCVLAEEERTVYISYKDGDDAYPGTEDRPFATVGKAVEAVADGGTVVFTDYFYFEESNGKADSVPRFTEPEHTGTITFTSKTDAFDFRRANAGVYFPESMAWSFSGDVVFDNINLYSDAKDIFFVGNFHEMTFGEGFDAKNTQGVAKYLFAIGGYMCPESKELPADRDVNVTIHAGNFKRLIAFAHIKGAMTYTFTGTANLNIYGGHIDRIYGGSTLNHYSGNLRMTVYDGSLGDVYTAGDATRRLLGNADVVLYGGTLTNLIINNVLGDTHVTLDQVNFRTGVKVTYGNDTLKDSAFGKTIALAYNSGKYTADFVNAIEGLTEITRFGSVYVEEGASGSGAAADDPTGDLAGAIRTLAAGGGDIKIVGSYTLRDFTEPEHSEPITISGDGELILSGKYTLSGNTGFDLLTLSGSGEILGGSHTLSLGDTLKTTGKVTLSGENIEISGGSFPSVTAKNLLQTGGKIETLTLSGDGIVAGGEIGTLAGAPTDTLSLSVSGGSIGSAALKNVQKSLLVRLGGGSIGTLTVEKGSAAATLRYDPLAADQATVDAAKAAFDKVETERVRFTADGGKGDGYTARTPLGTMAEAFAALSGGDGTVVVCGRSTISTATAMATGDYTITLTSLYDGADYRKTNGADIYMLANIGLYCPTNIDHVHFVSAKSSVFLVFDGYKGVVGSDVTCEKTPAATTQISLIGGTRRNNYACPNTDLTVNGGTWEWGYSGSTAAATFDNINYNMVINGGLFEGRVVAAGAGNQTGHAALTVNGGTVLGSVYGSSGLATETYTGDITITVNGGEIHGKITPATRHETTINGSYTLYLNGGDFGHLTDVEGKEKYTKSDMTVNVYIGDKLDLAAPVEGTITYQNPIRKTADPRIALVNGIYYYIFTSGQTLSVYKAANVPDLADAVGELVWDARLYEDALEGRTKNIWPSELQYFSPEEFGAENAGWYLFYSIYKPGLTDGGSEDGQDRRSYVLKCTSDDLQGEWVNPVTGEVGVPQKFTSDTDPDVNNIDWCAGESTLRYNGKIYACWIEQRGRMTKDFRQILYLSELKNPWTVTGKVLTLVEPEYDWEREGYGYSEAEGIWYPAVIEGATPIVGDNNELFVLYASSGYWTTGYKLGQMTYKGGDLLDISSWQKSPTSVFSKNSEVCGVGGPSAFLSPDGKSRYILYHGYLGKDTASGRYCFMEPYTVDASGVHIGVDGHPSPLSTVQSIILNPTPLENKIHGFDNFSGKVTVKLKLQTAIGYVNGAHKVLDAAPVIRNSRTMLPVRFLAEAFGAEVGWDGATSTATLTAKDGTVISITIGADHLTVNGVSAPLDSPAYIDAASNRTYLPVRAIAEALGATVEWDGTTSTATLTKTVR